LCHTYIILNVNYNINTTVCMHVYIVFSIQYRYGQTKFCYPAVVKKTKPKINFKTVTGKIFSISV
jgi:hypothetical protein